MRRDLNLIREIALDVEAAPDGRAKLYEFGPEHVALRKHIDLMLEHGLLKRADSKVKSRIAVELTWAGHDFVDSVRDWSTWKKVKKVASEAGGWTFDTLKDAAKSVVSQKLVGSLAAYAGVS